MNGLSIAILFLTGLLNAIPLIGVTGSARLSALYGIEISEPNLLVLMQHRAVLFGLLGGFMMFAAFKPELRLPAIIAGLVSMLSFVLLAKTGASYNALIQKIVVVDIVGTLLLLVALALLITRRMMA